VFAASQGLLLVFDVTDRQSFLALPQLLQRYSHCHRGPGKKKAKSRRKDRDAAQVPTMPCRR